MKLAPIQKAVAVLGILIGLSMIGWISNCSMKAHLEYFHRGTESSSLYISFYRVTIFSILLFSIGAIIGVCYIIWPKWFERFNRK